jgi:membrane-associated phospholipid phosphatase
LGLTPALVVGGLMVPALSEGQGSYALQDALILLNTFVLVTGLADGTKKLADRERPAVHYGRQAATEAAGQPLEAFLSFFSGDTAWAFSLAAAGTTLAALRGYESTPYIAVGGGLLALTTGVLRVGADMHWATDVITGAMVGTAVGILVPWLLHGRKTSAVVTALRVMPSLSSTHAGLSLSHDW